MAVPSTSWTVGWLDLGPRPGELGNAVIDGHLDSAQGAAIFWHLAQLRPGDRVYVVDRRGRQLTFAVTGARAFSVTGAPLAQIFGSSNAPNLNLITCAGAWQAAQHAYDQRLVVFTRLVAA